MEKIQKYYCSIEDNFFTKFQWVLLKRPAKIDQLNGSIILDVKYKKVSITRLCMVSKHILFLIKEKWKPTVEFLYLWILKAS